MNSTTDKSWGVRLHVWGERACFTRPEMKAERVSYDVITPSAARGVLEAVHWKPAIRWVVDRIHVLKPIRFESLRRNEVGSKISAVTARSAMRAGSAAGLAIAVDEDRQQRAATLLRDVAYVIEAHFERTPKWGEGDSEGKHLDMFNRRAREGQCFHRPYLGTREFPAFFAPVEGTLSPAIPETRDLGFMLHDINFGKDYQPAFFRATMRDGVIDVPAWNSGEIVR